MIEGGAHHRQVLTKRLQRLGVNAALNGREQHFLGFHNFAGDDDFLRIEQVDGDGDRFSEVTPYVLDHLAGQGIALVGRFADGFDRAVIEGQAALVALVQQMANAMFDGGVRRDGLQAAEVAAVAAFTQRIDLNLNPRIAPDFPLSDDPVKTVRYSPSSPLLST